LALGDVVVIILVVELHKLVALFFVFLLIERLPLPVFVFLGLFLSHDLLWVQPAAILVS